MNSFARRSGVLLVAKPSGVTSHDVVEQLRRSPLAKGARVGHAGTLDPFATGLLLVLVGQATRVQRYFTALPKSYRATARFGIASDTGDPTGTLTPAGEEVEAARVHAALPRLTGEIRQRVPLTSAVKVGGERLYRKARRGETVETPVRTVRVDRLELASFDERQQVADLRIDCSSGTYVRQLVEDLGALCGSAAHCTALERSAIGGFRLANADAESLIPLEHALDFLPERALCLEEARRAGHGNTIEAGPEEIGLERPDGAIRLTLEGRIVAIAEHRDGMLKPVTVLST